jgi:ATP-dependent helicase HrpB
MNRDLPILAHADAIRRALAEAGALVLCAPPGTGKSTQVPRLLLDRPGKILVLQPRRIAARNLALRVAEEMGEAVGGTVGYQVRFEGKARDTTRILFQTYGVFFQQLLGDPLLTGVGTVILDEFHERTLESDAALAWLKRLREMARPDLALVIMSATLELEGLRGYLRARGSADAFAPILEVSAESFPVEISYQPPMAHEPLQAQAARALRRLLAQGLPGSALVFMPGQGEIRRTVEELDPICRKQGISVHELHGSMDADAQQRALRAPRAGQCVIVSTNVAETSLTIDGVSAVIDSGLARIAAYSAARDMNTLYLGSISLQNARQRAGRAGRTAPGACVRLWSQDRERAMPKALDPEVLRVEPTSLMLSVHSLCARAARYGQGSLREGRHLLPWLTPPAPALWDKAEAALLRIGAVTLGSGAPGTSEGVAGEGPVITETGLALARFPVHPVMARVLLDADRAESPEAPGVGAVAAAMIAVLESQNRKQKRPPDLFVEGRDLAADPEARYYDRDTRESYRQLIRLLGRGGRAAQAPGREGTGPAGPGPGSDDALRAAVTACWIVAFQDRLAVRAEKTQSFLLADGRKGAVESVPGQGLSPDVRLILALELHETGGSNQSRQVGIPTLLPVEPAWVEKAFPGECLWTRVGGWDEARGKAVQEEQLIFRGLVLDRKPLTGAMDPEETERLLVEKLMAGEIVLPRFDEEAWQLVHRIRLAAKTFPDYGLPKLDEDDFRLIYHEICHGKTSLQQLENASVTRALRDYLGDSLMAFVDRATPVTMKLPGVKPGRITYFEASPPELSARLGDFIGMQGKTTILEGRVEVTYDILAPNYRTVQKTNDLTGFWKNTYPEVKKELKRRYPKHPWP